MTIYGVSTVMAENLTLAERIAIAKERVAAKAKPIFDHTPYIPVLDSDDDQSEYDNSLKEYVKRLDPATAIDRLTVKLPKPTSFKADGNKFRCPTVNHNDEHPSAWFSIDGKWMCGGCGAAGADWISLYQASIGESDFSVVMDRLAVMFNMPSGRPTANVEPSDPSVAESVAASDVAEDFDLILPSATAPTLKVKNLLGDFEDPSREDLISVMMRECLKDPTLSPEHVLGAAMTLLGLVVGPDVYLEDVQGRVRGNMFFIHCASSGDRKSATNRHLNRVIEAIGDDIKRPGTAFEVISGSKSGANLVRSVYEASGAPKSPMPIKYMLWYDEISGFMANVRRQGEDIAEKLMEVFDGDPLSHGAQTAGGRVTVKNQFGSMVGTLQTDRMGDVFKVVDNTSGFINRFEWLTGAPLFDDMEVYRRGAIEPVNYDAIKKAAILLREWATDLASIPGVPTVNSTSLNWSYDAEREYLEALEKHVMPIRRQDLVLKRKDLYFKKYILLFALNDHAEEIRPDHIRKALSMIKFTARASRFVFGSLEDSDATQLENRILELVTQATKKKKVIKHIEIRKSTLRIANKVSERSGIPAADVYRRTYDAMLRTQMIEEVEVTSGTKGGKTPKAYRLYGA